MGASMFDEPVFKQPAAGEESPPETLAVDRPVFPPPTAPLDVARKLYARYRIGGNGMRTLLAWRGGFMHWQTTHWSELDAAHLRSEIYDTLGEVDYKHPIREKGVTVDHEIRPWSPDKHKIANVIEAMAAIGHLPMGLDAPAWIGLHSAAESVAAQMISCENGLLDLSRRELVEHTPALFNVVSVPFACQLDATPPTAWLKFLTSIWPDDSDSVALLQEYVGYMLCGRTDMQKLLLLIGPTRSGKGTIARMLAELVGRRHVAGPTLASLGTNFGLSPLLGKPLAIISDARLGDTPSHTVVERLLSITGEDMLTVDRKFRDPWSGKLPTRFVILSNELPRFKDSSGAIANRLLILQMTNSFLGREDRTLDERLRAELPGILAWALEGLDRLTMNGKFTTPGSSEDAANLMMDLASPVSAFVRDECVRHPQASIPRDDLYAAWRRWAEDNGHRAGAKSTFGRNLRAVVPELRDAQPSMNGTKVRLYTRIALRGLDADDPVPPVPHRDEAGELVPPPGANPQVNSDGTGGTGRSAFKAHENGSPPEIASPATPQQHDRYRAGLCCDCGDRPPSAGRPRCESCHRAHVNILAGYDQ